MHQPQSTLVYLESSLGILLISISLFLSWELNILWRKSNAHVWKSEFSPLPLSLLDFHMKSSDPVETLERLIEILCCCRDIGRSKDLRGGGGGNSNMATWLKSKLGGEHLLWNIKIWAGFGPVGSTEKKMGRL